MLKQTEVWFSLVVERDDLAIHDGVLRKITERFIHERILPIERVAAPGKQIERTVRTNRQSAISIELDLVDPIGAVGNLWNGQTFHDFDECGFPQGQGMEFLHLGAHDTEIKRALHITRPASAEKILWRTKREHGYAARPDDSRYGRRVAYGRSYRFLTL